MVYVGCYDGRRVLVVDLERRAVVRSMRTPGAVTSLAFSPQEKLLCATCWAEDRSVTSRGPEPFRSDCVVLIDTAQWRRAAVLPAGHGPLAAVVSPDGGRLYVCSRFDNELLVIDLRQRRLLHRMAAGREPVAAALTPDGRRLVVADHLPADPADRFYTTATVQIIDTRTWQKATVRLPDGSTGVRGVCVDPQGRYAFVTHILANYQLVPAQVVGGWTNTNVLSIVDVQQARFVNSVQLDELGRGAANPWAAACTPDGRWLCVAHAGTHELSIIDLPGMLAELSRRFAGRVVGAAPHNPSTLGELRRRVELHGKGPRALAVCGNKAVAAAYFSDRLELVALDAGPNGTETSTPAEHLRLGPPPQWTAQRRGEFLFNDAMICYQHWQSCASCHPDGRADGLNWDLTNDGVGNPKNTKSLLLSARTPPAMSTGVRPNAEAAVRAGLEHILFAQTGEQEAAAIDSYLRAMRPVPSPHLHQGRLSPAAQHGRMVFQQAGCAGCHPPPLYTDLRSHDVGTQNPYDRQASFDTPTLIEVWRTAPYLHDGRYATLEELFRQGKHGLGGAGLEQLSKQQLENLIEFVRSL